MLLDVAILHQKPVSGTLQHVHRHDGTLDCYCGGRESHMHPDRSLHHMEGEFTCLSQRVEPRMQFCSV